MTDPFMIADLKEQVVRYGESGSLVDHSSPYGYRAVDPAERYAVETGCEWGGLEKSHVKIEPIPIDSCLDCKLPECVLVLQDRHPGRSKKTLVRDMRG